MTAPVMARNAGGSPKGAGRPSPSTWTRLGDSGTSRGNPSRGAGADQYVPEPRPHATSSERGMETITSALDEAPRSELTVEAALASGGTAVGEDNQELRQLSLSTPPSASTSTVGPGNPSFGEGDQGSQARRTRRDPDEEPPWTDHDSEQEARELAEDVSDVPHCVGCKRVEDSATGPLTSWGGRLICWACHEAGR